MSAFNQLAAKLAGKPGVRDPRGLAYAIGAKKYGASTMQKAAVRRVPAAAIAQQKRR